jgi:glutamate-5-semialdehyde dehydrogenase
MESIVSNLAKTHAAAAQIRKASSSQKNHLLLRLAELLRENIPCIVTANAKDLALMDASDAKFDRLLLDEKRILALAAAVENVAKLSDPAGKVLEEKILSNGLKLKKIQVPMGVIGTIFESRPNVTIDVAALCLMSGNACVLKGGKEAYFSNSILVEIIHQALKTHGFPEEIVCLLPTDRTFLLEMLKATRYVDLIIPRGSQGLIDFVRENSKIPTIETGAGVCHIYVEASAKPQMAADIIINARASRPSVCNSADCAIIDQRLLPALIPLLKPGFDKYQLNAYADEAAYALLQQHGFKNIYQAKTKDFGKEWLAYTLSIKTVGTFEEAIQHLDEYSSKHSEAIVTENQDLANRFLAEVDAAAVYHNASTRFTDGEAFGLGAEIGISTQKLHARGPFALEKLVTEKWILRGDGQIRI